MILRGFCWSGLGRLDSRLVRACSGLFDLVRNLPARYEKIRTRCAGDSAVRVGLGRLNMACGVVSRIVLVEAASGLSPRADHYIVLVF